jgi:DNA modification methylase
LIQILQGDWIERLRELPDASVQMCCTSPPYWGLRDYKVHGQLGQEKTPDNYVAKLVAGFREVRRALKDDGTLWLNLGDCYATNGGAHGGRSDNQTGVGAHFAHAAGNGDQKPRRAPSGLKSKDLVGIPWMAAFALRSDGWWLRQEIIWAKPNPMPESVTDRPTRAHEQIFLLAKSAKYFYDAEAIKEPSIYHGITGMDETGFKNAAEFNGKHRDAAKNGSQRRDKQRGHSRRHAGFNDRWDAMPVEDQCAGMRNKRSVWTVAPANFKEAHFATFPPDLIRPCIMAGSRPGDTVLDPFGGSGTTGMLALELGRKALLIELNPDYCAMIRQRCAVTPGLPI